MADSYINTDSKAPPELNQASVKACRREKQTELFSNALTKKKQGSHMNPMKMSKPQYATLCLCVRSGEHARRQIAHQRAVPL